MMLINRQEFGTADVAIPAIGDEEFTSVDYIYDFSSVGEGENVQLAEYGLKEV